MASYGVQLFGLGLIIIGGAYSVLVYLFAYYLKKNHPETWKTLGSPSVGNMSMGTSLRYGTWVLFGSGYRQLRDGRATTQVVVLRILGALLALIIATGIYLAWS